jgi:hypothetical protein
MIQQRWTTEQERQDLHKRSLDNIRKRRMERARALPEEMADLDLDEIPSGSGKEFDCRGEIRRQADVEAIIATMGDAWPKASLDQFPKYLGRRHLREDINEAWRERQALNEVKPDRPWGRRWRKCKAILDKLEAAKLELNDREGSNSKSPPVTHFIREVGLRFRGAAWNQLGSA